MSWIDLTTEVHDMFSVLEGCLDAGKDCVGWHRHGCLNLCKTTTKEQHTDETRATARAALEDSRKAYKARKQREYDRARRAATVSARACSACQGALGRPYRELATCTKCGAENFVSAKKDERAA